MRRLAAALLATTLLLAGCSSTDEPEATPTPSEGATDPAAPAAPTEEDVAALEAVTVEGDPGAAPTIEFDQPFEVSAPVARVDTEGDGEALEEGQRLSIHYVAVSGDDGSTLDSTWEAETPQQLVLGDAQILPALNDVLSGQNVGTRVLFAAPGVPEVAESEGVPAQPAVPATVMAIEVVDAATVPSRAEGEAVEPAEGLPVVTLAESGEPEIEFPADITEPDELVVQPLIEGDGPVVEAGQTITVHYKGWLWDGEVFDSSWEREPFPTPIGSGAVIAGWDEGLVGQTVGSQVLLVIPAEQAYGEAGQGSIPPDSTLVFVVDILDVA